MNDDNVAEKDVILSENNVLGASLSGWKPEVDNTTAKTLAAM